VSAAGERPAGDPAQPPGEPPPDRAGEPPPDRAGEPPPDRAGEPAPHRFGEGEPFTVGLEEELLLVDAETLQLAHIADEVVTRSALPRNRLDHEAFLAEVEVRSAPAGSVAAAVAQLGEGRAEAIRAGAESAGSVARAGATIMAAGLHPDAELFDVEIVQSERYERVERQMQGLIKRTPECALHVHVGMPDTDAAVAAMNGLRERLPLLHGLGANSPFWFGADSGMASSRAAVIRAYPGRGIPPALGSWEEYLACLDGIRAGGGPTDHTMVWWDARPQPRLGTVELREVDVQTDLESAAAIAALARAIARRAAEDPPRELAPEQALHWSSFRAARDGLDAEIYDAGAPRPLREVAERLVEELAPGADAEIELIKRIAREGNGADRQRAAFADGGMPALLRHLADATGGQTP
jgi:glutamate---cysteine ligase / carboxylate-amine ligase